MDIAEILLTVALKHQKSNKILVPLVEFTPVLVPLVGCHLIEPTIYLTRGQHANHYATDTVLLCVKFKERTTDHGKATGKLYHMRLRVEYTLFVIILFYLCPSVQDIFRRIFLRNYWWQKSDIKKIDVVLFL
jgi:hypothetical protein